MKRNGTNTPRTRRAGAVRGVDLCKSMLQRVAAISLAP